MRLAGRSKAKPLTLSAHASDQEHLSASVTDLQYRGVDWLAMCTRVIFRPHPEVRASTSVNDAVNKLNLNERQIWFVQQLQAGRSINAEDIVQHWKAGFATAKRDIISLRKNGLIEFVGAPKTGRYRMVSQEQK